MRAGRVQSTKSDATTSLADLLFVQLPRSSLGTTVMLLAALVGPWNERMGSRGEGMHPRGLDVKYSVAVDTSGIIICC
jgi:hypothetical protein